MFVINIEHIVEGEVQASFVRLPEAKADEGQHRLDDDTEQYILVDVVAEFMG